MGYDYFAGFSDTITSTTIAAVIPADWDKFQTVVAGLGDIAQGDHDPLEVLARYVDDLDECNELSEAAYEYLTGPLKEGLTALTTAFQEATQGITLHLNYASRDNFTRGSDLVGETYWSIGNHQQPTPAYAAFIAAHGPATQKVWISGG
jgi:hypothetical protein